MEIEENRRVVELQNLPFAQVPDVLPMIAEDRETMCVACTVAEKTHALIPCGHKCLCLYCLNLLCLARCPICNELFTSYLRVW